METSIVVTSIDLKKTEENIARVVAESNKLLQRACEGIDEIYYHNTELMNDVSFWVLINELNLHIKRADSHSQGVSNFMSNFMWGHLNTSVKFAGRKCVMSFVLTYRDKRSAVMDALDQKITDLSDDGFSDMVDSFPLFGQEMFEKAINREIEGDGHKYYQGENYMMSSLEKHMKHLCLESCRVEYLKNSPCNPFN